MNNLAAFLKPVGMTIDNSSVLLRPHAQIAGGVAAAGVVGAAVYIVASRKSDRPAEPRRSQAAKVSPSAPQEQ